MLSNTISHLSATLGSLHVLLKNSCKGSFEFIPCLALDSCVTRAQRTRKWWAVEVELYTDGSGFEVAFLGQLFMLGVEPKTNFPE